VPPFQLTMYDGFSLARLNLNADLFIHDGKHCENSRNMEELSDLPYVSVFASNKKGQRQIGAAVYTHEQQRSIVEAADEKSLKRLRLFEFCDNDQYSNLDCFLNQIGNCVMFLSGEITDKSKGDDRKIYNIVSAKEIEILPTKKVLFVKKGETANSLLKLVGRTSHTTNSVETEMPIALGCVECLFQMLRLCEQNDGTAIFELSYGALDTCMRLDSAAAEAVNLLPKPDHPSAFGSLYGILNRCRTKLGSRLLDRYELQYSEPLVVLYR
jgi:DNA mismatch repair protein MSH2